MVFTSVQGNSATSRLLRVPVDGSSAAVVISNVLADVNRFQYEPSVERVLVRSGSNVENLYSIAIDGSSFIPLTNFVNPAIEVVGFSTPTGVIYFADPVVDEQISFFHVDYLGQETRELSSDAEFFAGLVGTFALSQDRNAAYFIEFFRSSIIIFTSFRLRAVDLTDFSSADMAFIGNSSLIMGNEEFLRVLPNPTDPFQVFFIADDEVDEQADAYLATFRDGVFIDRFEQ
ncbi:MAG: hypothetical protein AAGJ52_09540 [Pseudomonadota bacterium]